MLARRCVNLSLSLLTVAGHPQKRGHRQVPVSQRLCLVALDLLRVLRVPLKVPSLQQPVVDLVQIGALRVEVRSVQIRMPVSEDVLDLAVLQCNQ